MFQERVLRSGKNLKISYPDGSPYAGQAIYEVGGSRYVLWIEKNEARKVPARPLESQLDFMVKDDHGRKMEVSISRGDNVLGRRTIIVTAADDRGNLRQKIWVDESKYVVLRREMYGRAGEVVGGYVYDRIRFDIPIPDSEFALPRGAKIISNYDELARLAKEMGMRPLTLGKETGFELATVRISKIGDKEFLYQFFTKGESQVSLIQMKGTSIDLGREFESRRWNVHKWTVGGNTLALVGEASENELKRLATRVKA
ncbi:hypothetical protein QPK87_17745 [Kamptonema cortianum]|nr:hypothetical protein [Geitlerinema splendidum]MDK3158399.1 hypothetical protein [Kamptonema cortianum]